MTAKGPISSGTPRGGARGDAGAGEGGGDGRAGAGGAGGAGGERYRVSRGSLIFTFGTLAALTAMTVVGILFFEPAALFAVFLLYPIWKAWQLLRVPTDVRFVEDGRVEFRGPARRILLDPYAIKEIKRVGGGHWLRYEGGSINLYGNMEREDELFARLKAANPEIEFTTFTWGQES